jgi:hypothetical protein
MKQFSPFHGPSLILLGSVHILLFAANLVAAAVLRHGAPYVNPFAAAETVRAFFALNPSAGRISSFFLYGSAIPFGLFSVTVANRLRFLGVRATGTSIAVFGGYAAAGALALSGLFGWVLSLPDVNASASLVRALFFLSFLFGGNAFAVGFGLLIAGVSITSHFARLLPSWLNAFGMFIAVAGELASLGLVMSPANFLIPITRYLGFVWLLLIAVKMPATRRPESSAATFESAMPV